MRNRRYISWEQHTYGRIKALHAVNNGPAKAMKTQSISNFAAYKEAHIPYARCHDAGHWPDIGGHHVVDIHGIFPDFSKDPLDPSSYDFLLTDQYVETTVAAGTEVFYRLGESIEHWDKKYRVHPLEDNVKWAIVLLTAVAHGW